LITHVSAQKRVRQSEEKRLRNAALKSLLKTSAKKVLLAVEEKNVEEARKALARVVPIIQKIASKKVIHKKTAARKISRLAKKVNTLTSPA
jgi:small subunit ribosomal protein S20